jgi:hypothetical protein
MQQLLSWSDGRRLAEIAATNQALEHHHAGERLTA